MTTKEAQVKSMESAGGARAKHETDGAPRLVKAFAYAYALHNDQVRRGSEVPYLTHLMAVASIVGEYGGDEDQVIAALLHDAVEDQGGLATLDTIRDLFGATVADYVLACSDATDHPKPPWLERKETFIADMRDASPDVKLIAAADKLHNTRSMLADHAVVGDALWKRFKGGRDGTLWYLESVAESLGTNWGHPIVDELRATLARLRQAACAGY